MKCPNCKSIDIIKKGRRKTKFGYRQLYYCKECKRLFSSSKLLYKTYGARVITNAITSYNMGNTLEGSAIITNRRFRVHISKSSISQWLKELKSICTYEKIRSKVLKSYGKKILVSKTFEHNGLDYNFKYHVAKLEMLCTENEFLPLMKYIKKFKTGCPSFFDDIESRCSQSVIDIKTQREYKYNNACRLADLVLKSCRNNYKRHPMVEDFMLINDSSTIACEVPVWLWEKNLDTNISGHIDILQIRSGKVYILDYKPGAYKENRQKVSSQLYWYASGLSFRTSIPLEKFMCAWFDDHNYYEFSPMNAEVRFLGSKWRSNR